MRARQAMSKIMISRHRAVVAVLAALCVVAKWQYAKWQYLRHRNRLVAYASCISQWQVQVCGSEPWIRVARAK